MNHLFKNIAWIMTILLILLVTQWGGVMSYYLKNKVISYNHDTIELIETKIEIDTFTNVVKGKTIRDTVIEIVESKIPLDTIAIINEYFKKHVIQTEYKDSNYNLIVTDTIAMNRLVGQFVDIKVYNRTITKNIFKTITKTPIINTAFYLNTDLTYKDKEPMVFLGGILTHKRQIYGAGYDPFNKSFKLTIGTLIYKK